MVHLRMSHPRWHRVPLSSRSSPQPGLQAPATFTGWPITFTRGGVELPRFSWTVNDSRITPPGRASVHIQWATDSPDRNDDGAEGVFVTVSALRRARFLRHRPHVRSLGTPSNAARDPRSGAGCALSVLARADSNKHQQPGKISNFKIRLWNIGTSRPTIAVDPRDL